MSLQLHFQDDAGEEPVELYHKLKLYGEDDPSGQASTKKPVRSSANVNPLAPTAAVLWPGSHEHMPDSYAFLPLAGPQCLLYLVNASESQHGLLMSVASVACQAVDLFA